MIRMHRYLTRDDEFPAERDGNIDPIWIRFDATGAADPFMNLVEDNLVRSHADGEYNRTRFTSHNPHWCDRAIVFYYRTVLELPDTLWKHDVLIEMEVAS